MEKFKEIYKGQERAHGCYQKEGGINDKGKMEGRSLIVRKPPTDDLWKQHLSGERSLGIIPITDDNTCQWGCIDIDDYTLDHKKIIDKIRNEEFPLIVCRSKSGGAHIFCFTKSFISARLMRQKLEQIAGELGYAGVRYFLNKKRLRKNVETLVIFLIFLTLVALITIAMLFWMMVLRLLLKSFMFLSKSIEYQKKIFLK